MWRTALGALIGMLVGIGVTVLILRLAYSVIAHLTAPKIYEIEYGVIYLTLVLGAGFGAVSGTLVGFTSAMLREWRQGRTTS